MTNHPHRSRLPVTLAEQAARDLIAAVTNPDRQWTIATAAACLPAGWRLSEAAEDGDFFPLTVEHLTLVLRVRAQREDVK